MIFCTDRNRWYFLDYFRRCPNITLVFVFQSPISEMTTLFKGLKSSHGSDTDGLATQRVKYLLDLIAPVITHIFNRAISSGVFPTNIRVASVTVIHEGGDKNSFSDYRPVSILSVFSKDLENLLNTLIENFSKKLNPLSNRQFGFRKNSSSEDALPLQRRLYSRRSKIRRSCQDRI